MEKKEIISLAIDIIKYKKFGWNDKVEKLKLKLMCAYFPIMTHDEMLLVDKALD
jgi:hypothetical protein